MSGANVPSKALERASLTRVVQWWGMGVVNAKFVPHPLRGNFVEQKNAPPSERLPERASASERDGAKNGRLGLDRRTEL